MIKKQVKNTSIFNERDDIFNKNYFDIKDKKFIHNLDNIYYSIKIENDWENDEGCIELKSYLDKLHDRAIKTDFVVAEKLNTKLVCNGIGFSIYKYDLESKNEFICFFSKSSINKDTPEVIVQIRAMWLWLVGESKAVLESYKIIENLLLDFGIEIHSVLENRIDFAYHTNYIQDPINFFNPKKLYDMQISDFNRWRAEGDLSKTTTLDYLGLGKRKSNNIYLRIYNKCQEVVRQGYKSFFLKFWFLNGLINRFDFYCLEKCFLKRSYEYLDKARLEFYLEHGENKVYKKKIEQILYGELQMDLSKVEEFANQLTPKVTIICNIEFQTKRKFYYTMDKSINSLKCTTFVKAPLIRLFKILENKYMFHEYLTTYVIRFIKKSNVRRKDSETASWWKILQKCQMYRGLSKKEHDLLRVYNHNVNMQLMKTRTINSISTLSLYNGSNDNSIVKDVLNFVSCINENDVEKALDYKIKKIPQLRGIIDENKCFDNDIDICLLNKVTGELFD